MGLMNKITGLYPGSFDPITNGHIDIILRASKVVDILIIGVAENEKKKHLFSLKERKNLIEGQLNKNKSRIKNVKVVMFDGLLMSFAEKVNANLIIRGLRAVSDFDYEFQMTGMNARLNSTIETVFLMASERHQFISSRFVKEICMLDGDVSSFVPEEVHAKLSNKFNIK
jgi:pantetheine-phosphate adenylyltransferase